MASTPTADVAGSSDNESWAAILCPQKLVSVETSAAASNLDQILGEPLSRELVGRFTRHTVRPESAAHDNHQPTTSPSATTLELAETGLRLAFASLSAFLQANVTGPVLANPQSFEAVFLECISSSTESDDPTDAKDGSHHESTIRDFRSLCQRSLDTDGVSPYPHIPYIELFCLARFLLVTDDFLPGARSIPVADHLAWSRLRVHLWHYKLLTQPSLGPGSLYTKTGRWTDVATLEESIQTSLADAETVLFRASADDSSSWPSESQVLYRLEEANCHILLGNDTKAHQALQDAARIRSFTYALSGALGKRTRFQETSLSQLVVLAKSAGSPSESTDEHGEKETAPASLSLNDDTLLEKIQFNEDQSQDSGSSLPVELRNIKPDSQPKLHPVDQIILLTEATLKDTFSPSDSLTLEEVLPYAVRVIDDKSVNWQIYTQALLVRSRIELNRSRTIERGVLQMQAVTDQVVADTQDSSAPTPPTEQDSASSVPGIVVTSAGDSTTHANTAKPTSFLPAPKPSESATPEERLRYVNALASPPRWHLESELAYAWTSVGSLVSALEIFKRLRLWPEVALCLATAAASDEASGRGAGGEEKARAIVRWQLFNRSETATSATDVSEDADHEDKIDINAIKPRDFYGPERSPPPPNAPRLFCILGDMENNASHYTRAWEISNRRFSRAQKSLGELHLQNKEWDKARQAYQQAVGVNRLSTELWNRLGDIELRLGHFPDAAEAFQKAIATANEKVGGEDARTWSNLGTAFLSWYREVIAEAKARMDKTTKEEEGEEEGNGNDEDEDTMMRSTKRAADSGRTAAQLLQDSLSAFKRGANLANTNWRVWDNVITLAASLKPRPALEDVLLGVKNVIRIRQNEGALDTDILTLLVREITKVNPPAPVHSADGNGREGKDGGGSQIYDPPRGSLEHKVISLFEQDIAPLITSNSACWDLISRLRAWRRDYAGALDAAEKAWRAAIGMGGSASTLSASSTTGGGSSSEAKNWLTDAEQWDVVVQRTSDLVAAYENYGARIESIGEGRWKGKARSAVRSVLGKAKESWEGDARWGVLKELMDGLR